MWFMKNAVISLAFHCVIAFSFKVYLNCTHALMDFCTTPKFAEEVDDETVQASIDKAHASVGDLERSLRLSRC